MGFITNIIILVIVLVIALSIVQVIFNSSSMSNLETALTNIGANVKSIAAPTTQNRAVSNCTAQVSSAMAVLSDKWFPDAQLSIVNTSIFSVNNTGQKVAILISEPTSAVIYNGGITVIKDNLTIIINRWINYWALETGEQGGINCYQNETRAGSYVCKDLEEIAQSNDTIAVGEAVRIAGNNNGQGYSIVLPVLCNAEGTLLPNSKRLLVSGSSNGDYLDQ
jgi:hypothetical protein